MLLLGVKSRWNELVWRRQLSPFLEFHEEFEDLTKYFELQKKTIIKELGNKKLRHIAVHVPIYVNAIPYDLVSNETNYKLAKKCIEILEELHCKNKPILVIHSPGLLGNKEKRIEKMIEKIKKLLSEHENVKFGIENMPYYAEIGRLIGLHPKTFVYPEDFEIFLEKISNDRVGIVLDIAHLFKTERNPYGLFNEFIEKFKERIVSIHIADAIYPNKDGLQIGDGEIDFDVIMKDLVQMSKGREIVVIPEIHNGHLNKGRGFKIALKRLGKYLNKYQE
ncbi:MAG: sugar phosphate isomerase/epimerase [Candidatus Parvarchaeota archaeon]|nr:sugar phosphate isomerase/epimerase [Candidatus Jingweiarchaeum tengchongense]MCW1298557.1 sugar phosphate isomerase/epimerase [Candidatus Jingweiarchaeum tengchongense]MCW1304580.1 sugar phosphate isomerase/epimerase [Candidatus Jingweiarchaeum tengchongense]MCW1309873.1 sugar phosphate isomerase/epimerase [Candidatus Jingweiarchaeum tengchongense]MCW1310252.1 sugar phosphate isomerase/epimerase [Candidatus Jingweiarchaeum tengchongense]